MEEELHIVVPLARINQHEHECTMSREGYYVEQLWCVIHRHDGKLEVLDLYRDAGRAEEQCRELAASRDAAMAAVRGLR